MKNYKKAWVCVESCGTVKIKALEGEYKGEYIAGVHPTDRQAENAQLIAAAPDLLEALKAARSIVFSEGFSTADIDRAIAKAEGVPNAI